MSLERHDSLRELSQRLEEQYKELAQRRGEQMSCERGVSNGVRDKEKRTKAAEEMKDFKMRERRRGIEEKRDNLKRN